MLIKKCYLTRCGLHSIVLDCGQGYLMIKSFKHKGLEKFFYNDDQSRIKPEHTARITRILDRLDASVKPQDMNLPGYKLHKLSGKAKGAWSVWVSGN